MDEESSRVLQFPLHNFFSSNFMFDFDEGEGGLNSLGDNVRLSLFHGRLTFGCPRYLELLYTLICFCWHSHNFSRNCLLQFPCICGSRCFNWNAGH